MDAIVIVIIALVLFISSNKEPLTEQERFEETVNYEVVQRPTAINESFYKDEDAFRRIVNELGFH